MSLLDSLVARLLRCQVGFWQVQARLQAQTDDEALHDLRIQLRRLRSVLRPLRKQACVAPLYIAAADLGRLTTPWRDLEVLCAHLQAAGLTQACAVRSSALRGSYAELRQATALAALLALLDDSLWALRHGARQTRRWVSKKRIRRYLQQQRRQLQAALAEPHGDRHRLRLLIKRLRYSNEVYGSCSTLSVPCMDALKAAQAALGDWHDLDQWCQRAAREVDLQPLQAAWQLQVGTALAAAEQPLQVLAKRLAERP